MKEYKIIPYGWSCTLEDCPPGLLFHFFNGKSHVGFKDEYGKAYNEAGEYLHTDSNVQPAIIEEEL